MTETQTTEVIETAPEPETVADAPSNIEVTEAEPNQPEPEADQQDGGEEPAQDSQDFPKKAVNALNRKDKKITKLRAQLREMESKLEEMQTPKERESIQAEDFDTYGDYLKAEMSAEVNDRLEKAELDRQKSDLKQQQELLMQQRDAEIATQAQEMSEQVPDLKAVMQPHIQTLDNLPEHVQNMFYELDNAPMAAYVLAKEGKIDSLAHKHPQLVAAELIQAQAKGLDLLSKSQAKPNPVSQAPKPMKAVKGAGLPNKNLHQGDVLKNLGLK